MTAALSDVTMEFDGGQAAGAATTALPAGATAIQTGPGTYEYHLPHTKTIDLIGEEFAPRASGSISAAASSSAAAAPGAKSSPNVVVVSAVPMSVSSLPPGVSAITSSTALPAGIQLQPGLPVSVISGSLANVVATSTSGQVITVGKRDLCFSCACEQTPEVSWSKQEDTCFFVFFFFLSRSHLDQ